MNRRRLSVLFVLSLLPVCGCGKSDSIQRVVVSGSVTLDGEPVADGQIRFVPNAQTVGPVTIELISGGKYICERNGGLPAGTHRVEILAWDPNVPPSIGPGQPPRPQWVAKEFNRDSTLTVLIDATESSMTKDFDVHR